MTTIKNRREQKREIDYSNSSIQRTINYSNILFEQNKFLKDNGVTNFALFDSSNGIKAFSPFSNSMII